MHPTLLLILLLSITKCYGTNILFLTILAAPSHHIWNEVLVGELLKNGHNITLMGHSKPKISSPNYTVILIEDLYTSSAFLDVLEMSKRSPAEQIVLLWDYLFYVCELDLKSKAFKDLMVYPVDHFELIVFDIGGGQCAYPFLDLFSNAKVIGISPFATPPYIANVMGHDVSSYVPMHGSSYGTDMNLWERTHNFMLQMYNLVLKYRYFNAMHKKTQEVFGNKIKSFYELEQKVLFLLSNNNPILDYPQPFPSNIIPVGGLHIKPANKLNDDLKSILDNAQHGVIYFSMGSIVQSTAMSQEIKTVFLSVFRELKQTILWKFESDGMEVPKNVIIRKWLPQNDILGHKNVVLFISHCGGLSAQEAIYNGVPVLGIPIIVDQHNNAAKIRCKGGGLVLNYYELSYDKLHKAITEILENPRYIKNMKRLSILFKDQQTSPLERAVFWIEYLLRNKDNYVNDLDHKSRYMSWYQTYSLHFLIFLVLFSTLSVIFGGIAFIFCNCKTQKEKMKVT